MFVFGNPSVPRNISSVSRYTNQPPPGVITHVNSRHCPSAEFAGNEGVTLALPSGMFSDPSE
eukprot:1257934-Rhodomonas_salina.13